MLTVYLQSFGFQLSGIPQDACGHGGGFVFDCRGLPNPGREAQYQALSGLDGAVQEYFARFAVVQQFAEACTFLVQQTVHSYRERNFEALMVSFGCTGGQHRSVYQVELMHQQLLKEEGMQIHVVHREQPRWSAPP